MARPLSGLYRAYDIDTPRVHPDLFGGDSADAIENNESFGGDSLDKFSNRFRIGQNSGSCTDTMEVVNSGCEMKNVILMEK